MSVVVYTNATTVTLRVVDDSLTPHPIALQAIDKQGDPGGVLPLDVATAADLGQRLMALAQGLS